MELYKYDSTPIIGAGVNSRRNNADKVAELLAVAQSYQDKTSIAYHDGQSVIYDSSYWDRCDCSSFVTLCLLGRAYGDTPYGNASMRGVGWKPTPCPDYNWAINPLEHQANRYVDGHGASERVLLATLQARWMMRMGWAVDISDGFTAIEPGDILFWARKTAGGDWVHPDWYLHINHIGFVLTKEPAPDTYIGGVDGLEHEWDKTKYPYKHMTIEVFGAEGATPACQSRLLERNHYMPDYMQANDINTVCLVCRPDLGALSEVIST